MRTNLESVFRLAVLAAVGGCATAPREAQEKEVRKLDPAACRLAVAVSKGPAANGPAGSLRFTKDAVGLRDAVVNQLASLNTASSVIGVADAADAQRQKADVLLDLSVSNSSSPSHRGLSSGWWSSGLLWLVTWIGGLITDDSTYETNLAMTGRLLLVGSEGVGDIGTVPTESGTVDLTYWDRNTVASLRFLQCLFIPPFWTTDDPELTSQALSDRATMLASVRFADYVKRSLERGSGDKLARFTLKQPGTNGARVSGATAMLAFSIESRASVANLRLTVNGETEIPLEGDNKKNALDRHTCDVAPRRIELQPGINNVRIQAVIGGSPFARTVLIHRQDV
jgi:hypothetical protein